MVFPFIFNPHSPSTVSISTHFVQFNMCLSNLMFKCLFRYKSLTNILVFFFVFVCSLLRWYYALQCTPHFSSQHLKNILFIIKAYYSLFLVSSMYIFYLLRTHSSSDGNRRCLRHVGEKECCHNFLCRCLLKDNCWGQDALIVNILPPITYEAFTN